MRQAGGLQLENGHHPGALPGRCPGLYEAGRWPESKCEYVLTELRLEICIISTDTKAS